MKIEELVEGEVYTTIIKNPGYIFRAKGNCKGIAYLFDKTFHKDSSFGCDAPDLVTNFEDYRLATIQEKQHFEQCYKAGKYVEYKKEEILFNYLIL